MKPSKIIHVDARVELPAETAVLFSDDPTTETPAQEWLMAEVPGADQMFPAGTIAAGPVLDFHFEGSECSLDLALLELDGVLMRMMDDASSV